MFEFSVASRYLIPRWRQLSVSIISLISIAVIGLVVWLIVVFFSVTRGLEKSWTEKLLAVTAPIRITPTEEYYRSYYYQIDGISLASDYSYKNLSEKFVSEQTDPYDPSFDPEVPRSWPEPPRSPTGEPVDLVKELFASIRAVQGVEASSYTVAPAEIELQLLQGERQLTQQTLITAKDPHNPALRASILEQETSPIAASEGVLLPKSFQEAGARIGDRGRLIYKVATASSWQEQVLPIFVEGFFDPGISPLGYRFTLGSDQLAEQVASGQAEGVPKSNGIHLYFDDLDRAPLVKKQLEKQLATRDIAPYFQIETFREYEYAKDLLQQLQSERNLFSFLSLVIIAVACSNIISMLIILVNDKKREIGILRAMGASSGSIAAIFGCCGMVMGALGSLLGIAVALLTLRHLQALIDLISYIQGFEAFSSHIFGQTLPNAVSGEVLFFVLGATVLTSLIAGVVPAVKASLVQPASILRSQ